MDFNILKQWREPQEQHESEDQKEKLSAEPRAKLPRRLDHHLDYSVVAAGGESSSPALPLFVTEPTKLTTSNLSADHPYSSKPTSDSSTPTKYPRSGGGMASRRSGRSNFSMGQWEELEAQALIYRHILAGAAVPPQLLHHLILINNTTKTPLLNSSSNNVHPHHLHPCNFNYPLHQYYPSSSLVVKQGAGGYWAGLIRGSLMDPEAGRCRRTDGKKWRCSRDVVAAGHKYCQRHMHRGRNRSRKPVEIIPTNNIRTNATPKIANNNYGACANHVYDGILKHSSSSLNVTQSGGGGGCVASGDTPHFAGSGSPLSNIEILHLSQRSSAESIVESQKDDVHGDDVSRSKSGQILRHFFDDWPRSLDQNEESENQARAAAGTNLSARTFTSPTNLSISVSAGNPNLNPNPDPIPTTSDFSLSLSTGTDGDHHDSTTTTTTIIDHDAAGNTERRGQSNSWVSNSTIVSAWVATTPNQVGGPLAEALRSSASNSSPTSVLQQLQRPPASETSYFTT